MKKVFILIAGLFLVFIILGCTAKQVEDPEPLQETINFSEEYEKINAKEESFDIYTIGGIEQFKSYLSGINEDYLEFESRDAEALVAFIGFRLNLLEAQKNILFAEERMELVVCEDENTFEEVISHLESAEANTHLTLISLDNFRTNFPEFLSQTRINDETQEILHALVDETTTAREGFISGYEASCLQ